MKLIIDQPGLHTSVQDLGRPGFRAAGVGAGGVVDPIAARLANWLVGNPESAAVLECAGTGPSLRFTDHAVVAVCGAKAVGIANSRPIEVLPGTSINLRSIVGGCYAYLAVAGGIDVPVVLASRSTEIRAGFGGLAGRLLRKGDEIAMGRGISRDVHARSGDHWAVNSSHFYCDLRRPVVHFIPGPESDWFPLDWFNRRFTISTRLNRMGVRLSGPVVKRKKKKTEMKSVVVCPGTIQGPPDGHPIVLLSDAATMGGYPRIGQIISADLPKLAQLPPGTRFEFKPVSIEQAREIFHEQMGELAAAKLGIFEKIGLHR